MKRVFTYQFFILIFIGFASCEKVVDLDLKPSKEFLVVDAMVSNQPMESVVRLSKSSPLFSEDPYQLLSGAMVRISYPGGNTVSFPETEPGIYRNQDFIGIEGKDYDLEVVWNNISVNANSRMPYPVTIDSIELVVSDMGFMGVQDLMYSLKVHYTDPVDEKNFYRFDVFKNDTLFNGFVVSSDLYYNGISTFQFFRNYELKEQDTVSVQLSCIDEANYSYFLVLGQSNSPFIIAPGNPISNLNGNAIGYFGAYAQDRKYFVVPALNSFKTSFVTFP